MIQIENCYSGMKSGAYISTCKKYRFGLWRIWNRSKPAVMFVMLNPSTADGEVNDPTIRRCMEFAKRWGAGGIYVANLWPIRATDPKIMYKWLKDCGSSEEFNSAHATARHYFKEMLPNCDKVVNAWGNLPKKQSDRVKVSVGNAMAGKTLEGIPIMCLGRTKSGQPKHPLYIPYTQALTPWV